jgi:hypothetical protein
MKLTDIFLALEAGELSTQTSLIDTVTGVKPENYSKVISHINLGLTNMHERLNIKLGDIWVMMVNGVGEYKLDSKHALTNEESDAQKWIIDSPYDPFRNNLIKILEVTTEIGEPLPINDRTKDKSVFTPSQNSIQIPWKVEGDAVNIVYRASHNEIRLSDYDTVEDIEVDLPISYLEPLLYFVAYRHFAGVGGQSGTPTSQGYYQKYQARMQEIELNGVPNKDLSVSTDFFNNNWV